MKDKVFRHIDEVIAAVSVAVNFYNNERPRMSIGMLIQVKAANLSGTSFRAKPSSQPLTGITTLGQQLSAVTESTLLRDKTYR